MTVAAETPTRSRLPGVVRVAGARIAAMAAAFVCSSLTVRIVIDDYGLTTFAAVSLVSTLVALIPFADLGLGTALTNLTVEHVHGEHRDRLGPAILAVLGTLSIVGLAIAGVVLGVANAGLLDGLRDGPLGRLGEPSTFLPLYAGVVVLWLLGGPASRLLLGLDRAPTAMLLQVITPALTLAATYLAAAQDAAPWALALLPLSAATIVAAGAWVIALRALSATTPARWERINRTEYRRLLAQGGSGLLLMIGGTLLLQTDRVAVAARGSDLELAQVAVALPAFVAIQSLLGAIASYLWPYYRRLELEGQQTRAMLWKHVRFALLAGIALALGLAALMPIYLWIVGYEGRSMFGLTVVLCLLVVAQSSTLVQSSVLTSPSMIRAQGLTSLGSGLVKVVLAVALIPLLGAPGAIVATFVAVALGHFPLYTLLMARRVP